MKNIFLLFVLICLSAFSSTHKTQKIYQGEEVIWGFDFLSIDEILFTERSGKAFYYNIKSKELRGLSAPKSKKAKEDFSISKFIA